MIRYRLNCDKGHVFEAWFANSKAYEKQAKGGLVECPQCGSTSIEKAIMSPNLGSKANKRHDLVPIKAANNAAAQQSPSHAELLTIMRRIRAEVEDKAEYVGSKFAEEARKIHYEETEARGIYGEASMEDAAELQDEGIEFFPLPRLPEERN